VLENDQWEPRSKAGRDPALGEPRHLPLVVEQK
jgi:hypothetical protein